MSAHADGGVGTGGGTCGLGRRHTSVTDRGARGFGSEVKRSQEADSAGNACATPAPGHSTMSAGAGAAPGKQPLRCPLCLEELPPRQRPRLAKRYKGVRGLSAHVEKMHAGDERSKGDALVALVATEADRVAGGVAPAQFRKDGRVIPAGGAGSAGHQPSWMAAACDGRVDGAGGVRQLVTSGTHQPHRDVDKHGYTSLCWAAGSNQVEAVRFLAQCTAAAREEAPSAADATPTGEAVLAELVRPMGSEGRTPLHWAARNGSLEVVRYVLRLARDAGAVDNGDTRDGRFAFARDSTCGCADTAQVRHARQWTRHALGRDDPLPTVLSGVVDVRTSCDGTTPLQLACYGGHLAVAQELVAAGANPFHRNDYWCSCAHWTCMGGAPGCVGVLEWLLASTIATVGGDAGGDTGSSEPTCGGVVRFDERQKAGVTALHKAAVKGAADVVTFLLQRLPRSTLALTDASGYTAEDLARYAGCDQLPPRR